MFFVKDIKIRRANEWDDNSIYVLTDYDRTLTTFDSETSWELLIYNKNIPKEYTLKCEELFRIYRPIEIDNTLDYEIKRKLMYNWWKTMLDLTKEYKIKEKILYDILLESNPMKLRTGTRQFLEEMNYRNIPVVIISGGFGNIIRKYLLNCNLNFDNIYIHSNFLKVEDGIIVGSSEKIVYSLNKSEDDLPDDIKMYLKGRENPILFGDLISDIHMANERTREKALKIGFLKTGEGNNLALKQYIDKFDVVCTDGTGFDELTSYIKVLKR